MERGDPENKEATIDDLLPAAVFAVPAEVKGLTYETHIYDYLVFRTYSSNWVTDMGAREKAEGLYVEKPVCDTYRRQHFPATEPEGLMFCGCLAELEEQG